jgi:hypothetical protein
MEGKDRYTRGRKLHLMVPRGGQTIFLSCVRWLREEMRDA